MYEACLSFRPLIPPAGVAAVALSGGADGGSRSGGSCGRGCLPVCRRSPGPYGSPLARIDDKSAGSATALVVVTIRVHLWQSAIGSRLGCWMRPGINVTIWRVVA